jgi:predicted nucleotidyltransferase component of viral defense system
MNAARARLAHSVQTRLVRHARDIGVDPNLVLTRYAVERFLYRLSRSRHAEQFVLKGALLLLVWLGETLRPTRDADLLGFGDMSDDVLREIVRDICTIDVEPDAVIFLPDTVHVRAIREEDTYGGQRVALEARLGPARLRVQVDVGIGDAVTPAPQWLEYPTLLDLPRPRLRAYPRETVIAEKLHAMVVLGTRNSRLKDYFDVEVLLREDALDAAQLAKAIASTFERRRTDIPRDVPSGLSDAFSGDATCQARWAAFLDRNRLQGPPLGELVRAIRDRLAPAMAQARGQAQP